MKRKIQIFFSLRVIKNYLPLSEDKALPTRSTNAAPVAGTVSRLVRESEDRGVSEASSRGFRHRLSSPVDEAGSLVVRCHASNIPPVLQSVKASASTKSGQGSGCHERARR